MLRSKYSSPLDNFVCHGTKDTGGYTYVLLIDLVGLTISQRIKNDDSEVLFALKAENESIADFWTGVTGKTYKYFYLL